MRVAIVLNTSWNIYNFRLNFVKTLLAKGYEVHTVAPKDTFTHYLTDLGCIHHGVRMDSRGINPMRDIALIAELCDGSRSVGVPRSDSRRASPGGHRRRGDNQCVAGESHMTAMMVRGSESR